MSARGRRARRRTAIATIASFSLLALTVPAVASPELAEVRAATAPFHRVAAAEGAGWDLVPGLDHCFENPGVGAMGYHYIDTDILMDTDVDPARPEALVYAPGPNGQLRLAAVEWIVPDALWTGSEPPMVLGRDMHLNTTLGVWVLHAWIFQHNPAGMFADWNPRVSCS